MKTSATPISAPISAPMWPHLLVSRYSHFARLPVLPSFPTKSSDRGLREWGTHSEPSEGPVCYCTYTQKQSPCSRRSPAIDQALDNKDSAQLLSGILYSLLYRLGQPAARPSSSHWPGHRTFDFGNAQEQCGKLTLVLSR